MKRALPVSIFSALHSSLSLWIHKLNFNNPLKMVLLRRKLACCTWNREINKSIDFGQPPPNVSGIVTYNGLESCIQSANSCEDESVTTRGDECPTDSLDEDASNSSSVTDVYGSISSHWMIMKRDDQKPDEWESARHGITKDEPLSQICHVEIMKETFSKLLLGEDTTGGSKGHSSALALSNSITKLAQSVFGELWKLEPLPEDRKDRWRREMEWLLAPTNYMVELVPAKQYGANGRALEIMRPKARADVHINLPALQKLDSLLLEMLDTMTNTEHWYEEGSRSEGKNKSVEEGERWWLPMPRVPAGGLSNGKRKRLLNQAKLVHQIFKAAKSINETILAEMPIPKIIGQALPKSGKANLGDDLYRTLNTASYSAVGMLNSLNIKSEHNALVTINRLEAAIYAWKERVSIQKTSTKSPARTVWSFKDPSELNKMEFLINRAEVLMQQIRNRYPNLPQSFLHVMKIQYGKDIAYAILEAYSRVLGNLAFNMLARIGDICHEDESVNPNSPMPMGFSGIVSARHTLFDKMNYIDGKLSLLKAEKASYTPFLGDETNTDSIAATPSRIPHCCIGKEVCYTPPKMSP
uniref:Putative RHO guanyl-nucleotide exchange factor 14 n=2 Tax=Helianthus annuus TaxID=4232 RepID=A0A251U639_HELAN